MLRNFNFRFASRVNVIFHSFVHIICKVKLVTYQYWSMSQRVVGLCRFNFLFELSLFSILIKLLKLLFYRSAASWVNNILAGLSGCDSFSDNLRLGVDCGFESVLGLFCLSHFDRHFLFPLLCQLSLHDQLLFSSNIRVSPFRLGNLWSKCSIFELLQNLLVPHLLKQFLLLSLLLLTCLVKSWTRILHISSWVDQLSSVLYLIWHVGLACFKYFFFLVWPPSWIEGVDSVELCLMVVFLFTRNVLPRVVSNLNTTGQTLHQIAFWHIHDYLLSQHKLQWFLKTELLSKGPRNLLGRLTLSHDQNFGLTGFDFNIDLKRWNSLRTF